MISRQSFKQKLDDEHNFPTEYLFKFIVPKDKEQEMYDIFSKSTYVIKPSSGGNYLSFTARVQMQSSDDVITIYERAYTIEGIISL
ncbi:MAG: DUF493 family protein [Cyclobacteriaceae bacterium]